MQASTCASTYSPDSSSSAGAFPIDGTPTVPADSFANACNASVRFENKRVEFLSDIPTTNNIMYNAQEAMHKAHCLREDAREALYVAEFDFFAKIAEGTTDGDKVGDAAQGVVDDCGRTWGLQLDADKANASVGMCTMAIAHTKHSLHVLHAYLAENAGALEKYNAEARGLLRRLRELNGISVTRAEAMRNCAFDYDRALTTLNSDKRGVLAAVAKKKQPQNVVAEDITAHLRVAADLMSAIVTTEKAADDARTAFYLARCAYKTTDVLSGIFASPAASPEAPGDESSVKRLKM